MPPDITVPLAPLLKQLGIMLTLALFVERAMTALSWIIDRAYILISPKCATYGQKLGELQSSVQAKSEEDLLAKPPDTAAPGNGLKPEIEPNPEFASRDSGFDIIASEPPEALKVLKEFWISLVATLVAIAACYYSKFSIWIFVKWAHQGGQSFTELTAQPWEFILTGIIVGAGSKPVNFLMNFLVTRKIILTKTTTEKAAAPETAAPAPVKAAAHNPAAPVPVDRAVTPLSIEELIGFEYDGGDRPQRLEHTHKYRKAVDMIVYHHTAMHSDAPFEELVKEFDRKGWLTGYHCVIMKDGTIRILCRWDRFGNHAYGYNGRSMGVALQGNFETNPRVPFSNSDGHLGIQHPTAEQIDSMAKIVALWSFLHDIPVVFPTKSDTGFPKGIIPHYEIAPKACPGNNFPHESLRKSISDYVNRWKQSDDFKLAVDKFKAMPMVMAGGA